MKRSLLNPHLLAVFIFIACLPVVNAQQELPEGFKDLEIGAAAPDFDLPGIDGKNYTLKDFADPDVLMVYFTGTHCPTSHGVEKRLQTFLKSMKGTSFGFVAINPNHSSGLRPDEFGHTKYDETFADSKRYAKDLGWEFPFLYDGDKQQTARDYGCRATPHVFVFDSERKLRYNGRFDDSRLPDPASVKSPDAINAVKALLAGEPVLVEKTRPHGCSTKWKERSKHVAKEEAQWQAAKVTMQEADAAKINELRKNGSGKIRLFNVWSTSCSPCVEEIPDLAKIARKFSRRDFELITISMDLPKDKQKAEAFLGKHRVVMSAKLRKSVEAEGRATNNYLYTGASIDDLVEALDPKWPGPMPYSLLVDGDGEVLYRKSGIVDATKLSDLILDTMTHYHTTPIPKRSKKGKAKKKSNSKKTFTESNPQTLVYEGTEGIGKGKHIVFIANDHEYRSEQTCPAMAKILAKRHGFKCTVLFGVDKDGHIKAGGAPVPGMEALKDADLLFFFARFMKLPDDQANLLVDYFERGGPAVGIRTSTHCFNGQKGKWGKLNFNYEGEDYLGGLGEQIFGNTWHRERGQDHYGSNHATGALVTAVASAKDHPINSGVGPIHSWCGAYRSRPPADATPLVEVQVLDKLAPGGEPVKEKPLVSAGWTREFYVAPSGDKKEARVVYLSFGASEDLFDEDARRSFTNACLWAAGMEDEIKPDLNVEHVGGFAPSSFTTGALYYENVKPSDLAGWDSQIMPAGKSLGGVTKPKMVRKVMKAFAQRPELKAKLSEMHPEFYGPDTKLPSMKKKGAKKKAATLPESK